MVSFQAVAADKPTEDYGQCEKQIDGYRVIVAPSLLGAVVGVVKDTTSIMVDFDAKTAKVVRGNPEITTERATAMAVQAMKECHRPLPKGYK